MGHELQWWSSALHEQLLLAHASDHRQSLVDLYIKAADAADAENDQDAARFYLTQAYVFALDTGSDKCDELRDQLSAYPANIS